MLRKRTLCAVCALLFLLIGCGCTHYQPENTVCEKSDLVTLCADLKESRFVCDGTEVSLYRYYDEKSGDTLYYLINLHYSNTELLRVYAVVNPNCEFDTSEYENPVNDVVLHGFSFRYTTLLTDADEGRYESVGILATDSEVYYLKYTVETTEGCRFYDLIRSTFYAKA